MRIQRQLLTFRVVWKTSYRKMTGNRKQGESKDWINPAV